MAQWRPKERSDAAQSDPDERPSRSRWRAPSAPLGVVSFGLALGVTAAIIVFLIGVTTAFFGWGILVVQVLSTLLIGYEPSFVGAVAGAVWAFVDGFVAGMFMAWLYNRFTARDHH
jgi:fructose-specific phosphotransferase system IIC component